jgi:sporulation protein YlmC with PRC-barrel domain
MRRYLRPAAHTTKETAMPHTANLSDWRGKQLLDRDGDKIGKLEDVYVDTETDAAQFGTVKEGLLSKHLTFVPLVDATTSPDHLQVTVSKEQVKAAPNIDTDAELTAGEEAQLYDHFGMPYAPGPSASGRRLAKR